MLSLLSDGSESANWSNNLAEKPNPLFGGVVRAYLIIPVLSLLVVAFAATDEESGIPLWLRLRGDLAAADDRLARLELELEALRTEIRDLETDPFAQERAIREDLFLAKPGETIIRFVETGAKPRAIFRGHGPGRSD